jgi:parvulin-like peptidyl-prolyl isomerase
MITLLAALSLAAAPPPPPADEAVARVDGTAIGASELRDRIVSTRSAGGNAAPELLVEDLVNEAVMAAEGYKLGLAKDPEVVAAVAQERRRLAGIRLVEREINGAAALDDAQLLSMYHLGADSAHLLLVVLPSKEDAEAALGRLKKGGKVADEASHSLDPATLNAGDYGTRSRGQLPVELEAPAFSVPTATWSGPVTLSLGFGVFQVVERSVADASGFAAKREDLKRFAEAQQRSRWKSHYVAQLRKAAGVKVDEEFLKTTGTRLGVAPKEGEHVLATVGGRPIKYSAVADEVRRIWGGKEGGHASGPGVKTEIAWSLVDAALIEEDAVKRKLHENPEIVAASKRKEREAVVRALSARERKAVPAPPDADVEAHYRQHAADFRVAASRPCSHLVVADEAIAKSLADRSKKGEAFDDLARQYSKDSSTAAAGGQLGAMTDERLSVLGASEPSLAAAIQKSKPGEVAGPVKSKLGWHLVLCGVPTPATTRPLAEVKEPIAEQLRADRGNLAVVKKIRVLREKAKITIDRAAIARAVQPPPGAAPAPSRGSP